MTADAAPAASGRHLTLVPTHGLRDRLVARDERALSELVDQTSPWLLGLTHSMVRDGDIAEEIVMDSYRQLWDRASDLPATDRAVIPWLLTITRNRAIDRLRADRRREKRNAQLALHEPGDGMTELPSINESGTPGWHVHSRVHAALGALRPDEQQAIRMAWFDGLSHSEIAEALAEPLGTVKSRLRRAHQQLRDSLADLRDWI